MTSRELRTEPVYNLSVVRQDLLLFPNAAQKATFGPQDGHTDIRLDGCARILSKTTLPGWLAHVHRCGTPLAARQSAERIRSQQRGRAKRGSRLLQTGVIQGLRRVACTIEAAPR